MTDPCNQRTVMKGVREHAEEMPVELVLENGRICVCATNEAGFNHTLVDLLDLLDWTESDVGREQILRMSRAATLNQEE